jgi:hypothetical protein
MIDNFYVYETPDFLDIPYIQTLVMLALPHYTDTVTYMRIDTSTDAYLTSITEKFKFLSPMLNVYCVNPLGNIPLHIDAHRLAAFNIPIQNCDETSQTIYYDGLFEKVYKPNERHYRVNGEMKEVYRFAFTKPALIRNDVAHEVKRVNGTAARINASWGVAGSFEQCRSAFKQILEKS